MLRMRRYTLVFASSSSNTHAVFVVVFHSDVEALGISGVGYRKKLLHAVEQLRTQAWRPKASESQTRCGNCHRYRSKGSKHTCGEAEKCTALSSCPSNYAAGHSETQKRKRKEQREQTKKQRNEQSEQHKKSKEHIAQQFLEEELRVRFIAGIHLPMWTHLVCRGL